MSLYPIAVARAPDPNTALRGPRCATLDCPLAAACRRKVSPGLRRRSETWHWRRSSFSDAVICNGFEPVGGAE